MNKRETAVCVDALRRINNFLQHRRETERRGCSHPMDGAMLAALAFDLDCSRGELAEILAKNAKGRRNALSSPR